MIKNIFISTILFLPHIIHACAVCYGDPESPMTDGMNKAIIFLLSIIGFILLSIIFSISYFYRRAKLINNNLGDD
ncbi:MAG: hypothetical protein CMF96_09280 [Candidatus Marinimicrobia bacterium]|nr:hypothetical protein [Candidatus Neomarinimicrobiota bacterium]|tara:strand:- start:11335 stop:11559 length:225 start_codon:yes stop_codon:yes gene_type:complete